METILVVDDVLENRDMLSRRLTRQGYNVLTADGGKQALELLEYQAVDLILLDVMMPDMSGIDVLKELRPRRPASELPIIMVSAATESPQVVEAMKAGANDYVTKPVDFPVALARIKSALARRVSQVQSGAFDPQPGSKIGDYELRKKLGQGGMGAVFLAEDGKLGRPVAVKLIVNQEGVQADDIKRFIQEARTVARVRHPSVVAIYDVGSTPCPYLVMEFVAGQELDAYAKGRSYREKAELMKQLAGALQAVHEAGVIHRDLKPANVMVDEKGTVKVMDFGLARPLDVQTRLTQPGYVMGTPSHMAPEQVDSDLGEVDCRADLWAFGVILYEMLTGQLPFPPQSIGPLLHAILNTEPPSPRKLAPDVPVELESICLKALAKKPARRWSSARDIEAGLAAFLA